jgi:hypothetical protein
MKSFLQASACLLLVLAGNPVHAYPVDAAAETGIERLEGYRQAQYNQNYRRRLPKGAQLPTSAIQLRLLNQPELTLPPVDQEFTDQVKDLLQQLSGDKVDDFGVAVLDTTDPQQPVYAEYHADKRFSPGSVGKLGIAMGVFQALANAWPGDIAARQRVLRDSIVTADTFIGTDHHTVPIWDGTRLYSKRIRLGDSANLYTYLDWMLSASSNAAAAMVTKHMMLLSQFGRDYPVTAQQELAFFTGTKRDQLRALLLKAFEDGLRGSGIDSRQFRQGSFFSSTGKRRVPGLPSHATPRELMRFLLHLEQGKVVDEFSSLEIKRLLYITQRRIRYASSPALNNAAVYFKSGSFYKCRYEEGFKCGKYRGNKLNLLNSVAIIESPAGDPNGLHYMVVMTSNVLKENAAVLHQSIGTYLHRLIEKRHAVVR